MVRSEFKPTKAQQMRLEIARLQATGQAVSPKAIIQLMAEKGIRVLSGEASTVIKNFPKFRAAVMKELKEGTGAAAQNGNGQANGNALTLPALIAARAYVAKCGGHEQALSALEAIKVLSEPAAAVS